jgi:hypothetical protein
MPALNFKSRFAPLIRKGKKPFTLRAFRKDNRDPKAGQTLFMFTGQRTKQCRRIGKRPCVFTCKVRLLYHWLAIDHPDGESFMLWPHLEQFAQLDGFKSYAEFCEFHGIHDGMKVKTINMIGWKPLIEIVREIMSVKL